ncbi:MAG: ABC-2 family transporter protein [Defluviitaleaceae bacterium]|nr:ABC-2 family transporter protein [Defluviitaleaceae bacterium]
MLNALNLYGKTIIVGLKQFVTYRTNIFARVASALFMLGARYALWVALFATGNTGDTSLAETMTYFVVLDILMVWTTSAFGERIGADIQSGDIATALTRPRSYHFQLLSGLHSEAVARAITHSLPILTVAILFIGILPPVSLAAFGMFILAAIMGGVIYILVDLTISYSAFWLMDYWYINWYKRALFMLFGGIMLPLWFYPEWLRSVSYALPFSLALFMPLQVYLGRVYGSDIIRSLGLQVVWIVLLFALERLVWSRVQHKIVVQGG